MTNSTNTVDDLTVPLITAEQVFSMFNEGALLGNTGFQPVDKSTTVKATTCQQLGKINK